MTTSTAPRILVTGGIRSGKSAHAEHLATTLAADDVVTYLATGQRNDSDAEWSARIAAHQQRRPTSWHTVEASDPVPALASAHSPILLDDLGSWLASVMDELSVWSSPDDGWRPALRDRVEQLCTAVAAAGVGVVVVTSEVGLTLVADNRAGRLFSDELGHLNQRMAQVCDRVDLVVAGCPLTVKNPASPR